VLKDLLGYSTEQVADFGRAEDYPLISIWSSKKEAPEHTKIPGFLVFLETILRTMPHT